MRAIHLVFHVLQLEPASWSSIPSWVPTLPPPVLIEGELEFKISEILNSKVDCLHCLCKLLYLVYWSGYEGTDKETSWILASKLICISLDLSLICIFNSYLNLFSYSDSHTLVSELDLQIMIFIYKKKLLSSLIFLGLLLGLLFQLHHFLIQRHLLCWIFFSFFLLLWRWLLLLLLQPI